MTTRKQTEEQLKKLLRDVGNALAVKAAQVKSGKVPLDTQG